MKVKILLNHLIINGKTYNSGDILCTVDRALVDGLVSGRMGEVVDEKRSSRERIERIERADES